MNMLLGKIIQQAFIDANNMALIENAFSTADFLEKCSRFVRYATKNQKDVLIKDEIKALKIYTELLKIHSTVDYHIKINNENSIIAHLSLIETITKKMEPLAGKTDQDTIINIDITENDFEKCVCIEVSSSNQAKDTVSADKEAKIFFK